MRVQKLETLVDKLIGLLEHPDSIPSERLESRASALRDVHEVLQREREREK